jgi:hypothetical protein
MMKGTEYMHKGLEVVKFKVDASVLCQYFAGSIDGYHKTLKHDGNLGIEI